MSESLGNAIELLFQAARTSPLLRDAVAELTLAMDDANVRATTAERALAGQIDNGNKWALEAAKVGRALAERERELAEARERLQVIESLLDAGNVHLVAMANGAMTPWRDMVSIVLARTASKPTPDGMPRFGKTGIS